MDDKEKVLESMREIGKPVRPGEVADATGIEKADVSKLIQALKKEDKVVSPKRCFWEPK